MDKARLMGINEKTKRYFKRQEVKRKTDQESRISE